jgi:hypothetical protein
MKRCSQCEFIYEDDQSVCDMDGGALIVDNAFTAVSVIEKSAPITRASSLRGIALPASAGLLLALLFSVGFFASADAVQPGSEAPAAQLNPAQNLSSQVSGRLSLAIASVSSASSESPVSETSDDQTIKSPEVVNDVTKRANIGRDALSVSRAVPPLPRVRPLPRLPAAKALPRETANINVVRTAPATQRKATEQAHPTKPDSKVGGFLKKTGRLLSKPFKF